MIDDARLKALEVAGEAKKAVNEVLSSLPPAEAKELKELRTCLEEVEEDLQVTVLDQHIAEVQAYQHRLLEINGRLDKHHGNLKEVSRKVENAAKAIGVAAEVASKVAIPPLP
ncbi:hypothetical protein [Geomonas sp.]|uniref:hypothetical protein n=1 Tax=Geomonas sp. TaxID=2651584 RepID=UPI002B49382D|nr:hypothetical protein [Geomonas sp.]HJV34535.1 hypothetical protein [Geomonas sp.]